MKLVSRCAALLLASAAPAVAAEPAPDAAQLQASIKQGVTAQPVPVRDGSEVVPGAFGTTKVTPLDRCHTRFDFSRTAFAYQGQQYPAATGTAEVDWGKVWTIDYRGTEREFVIAYDADKTVSVPTISSDSPLPRLATALQLACGAFSVANNPVPPGAPPRWAQVHDPEYRGWVACRYAKLPDLSIEHGWAGRRAVRWKQDFERDRGELIYSAMEVLFTRGNGEILHQVDIILDEATDQGFTTQAKTAAVFLDGAKLETPFRLRHDSLGGSSYYNIQLEWHREADAASLMAKLATGSTLVVRAYDAQGREMRRAQFDVRSLRNASAALTSTNWGCIL